MAQIAALTGNANPNFAIGPNGATNPTLSADGSVASAATGVKVKGNAAAAGADLFVTSSGTNDDLRVDAKGSGTISLGNTSTGAINLKRDTVITGKHTQTSADSAAMAVGPNGATNPSLQVDASTSSAATGVKVKSAAAASGVAVSAISSGTDENMTVDAKGAGTITLNGTATGNVISGQGLTSKHATKGLGYSTGAGGTVTQATSKSTGVTLNKVTGTITMNNAQLNAGVSVGFTLTNSAIAATDIPVVAIKSGATADSYNVTVDAVAAGSCRISVQNKSGGNLSEALVLSFAVIKGVAA
jgi:hypothetical protein